MLKSNANRICLVTNYRTGSSNIITNISETNRLQTYGEYFAPVGWSSKLFSFDTAFRNVNSVKKFTLKLMADHVDHDMNNIARILDIMNEIKYLYRRDFTSQALSYIAARTTHSYAVTGYREMYQSSDTTVHVRHVPVQVIEECCDILINNYKTMAKIMKIYPGDVLCLEDLSIKKPYTRTITWEDDVVDIIASIPKIDVESILFS